MQKFLVLCFILTLSSSVAYCESINFPPLQKTGDTSNLQGFGNGQSTISSLPDQFTKPSITALNQLDTIEQTLFGKNFAKQNTAKRLTRIEQKLFAKTYATAPDNQRIDNIISNFNQMNKYPNISSSTLTKIEKQVLCQSYEQNNPKRRVERLEEQMFGAAQSGDLTTRYEALKIASQSYKTRNLANADSYFNPSTNVRRGFFNNWGGSMTGYTPNMSANSYGNNYNSYNSGYMGNSASSYGANSFGNYGGSGRTPTRCIEYNGESSFGTGMGVHILD